MVLVYLCRAAPPPALSQATYDRIHPGMTAQEVERVVGTRPGGYDWFLAPGEHLQEVWGTPVRAAGWGNRDGILTVGYDAEGRVCLKALEYHPAAAPEPPARGNWWARLRNRSVPHPHPYAMHLGPF
ncbi:MAG: hypothetical protein JWO38_421 [Gemmataceae bacterium]|nr:hypothetical protein [Gemmataceae bacterium]